MLSVVNEPNMECHYAECRNVKCHYAECHYSECHYSECHYSECHYAECRSAFTSSLTFVEKAGAYPQSKSLNSLSAQVLDLPANIWLEWK